MNRAKSLGMVSFVFRAKGLQWGRNPSEFTIWNILRLSWGTSQELMAKNCLEIEWEDKEDEDDEKQKKLKAGSKRGESADIQIEKKKGRKAAFFREHKIARTNFQDFLTAF